MIKKRFISMLVLLAAVVTGTWAQTKTLAKATTDDYGKVVCAAGHLHDAKTAVPDGCTAVGILGKVTETGHGLILALQDATAQTWNTINGWTAVDTYAGTTLKLLPDDAARGANLTSYTALGETTVSNWAVAQKSDYEAIFTNLGSTAADKDGTTYDGNVNAYITTGVGGAALSVGYWSATEFEYDGSSAWEFLSYYWYYTDKTNSYSVRPVLAFAVTKYNLTLADGTEDATSWQGKAGTGDYQELPLTGLEAGTAVSVKYNGTKKVKSVKGKKKAPAAAEGHALSASVVGELVGSDGKAYAVADKDKLPQGVTAVAMVAYVGTASDCAHGLAIALADESGTKDYWAAGAACSGKAAVTGGTWRLPSIKDWQYMFIGCGASGSYSDNPYSMSYSGLASKLTTAQGDALQADAYGYWSSTEYDPGESAWYFHFEGSDAYFTDNYEDIDGYRVRACLAF